eukprot:10143251-Karenia_brevis.AAC.1
MDRNWCPRNFLHTYHLGFEDVPQHGGSKQEAVCIISALPQDLRQALEILRPVDGRSARLQSN